MEKDRKPGQNGKNSKFRTYFSEEGRDTYDRVFRKGKKSPKKKIDSKPAKN